MGGQYVGCQTTACCNITTRSFLHVFAATAKVHAITRQFVPMLRRKLRHELVLHGFYVDLAKLEYGLRRDY